MSPRLAITASQQTPQSTPQAKNVDEPRAYEAFGPLEHVQALHPRNGRLDGGQRLGTVSFGQRVRDYERPWREWSVDVSEAAHVAADLIARGEAHDLYFSQNSFRGWRRIAQLSTLGACYVDLDYRKRAIHAGKPPEFVAMGVLALLDDEGIPAPSFIMATGRGLCAVWLTELLRRAALPRWQAVQNRIATVLTPFGPDKAALDAARVFRVAGSVNTRVADDAAARVHMVWCQGDPASPFRHVFSDLADEILPYTRAELHSILAERAKRKASGKACSAPAMTLTAQTWAEAMLTDLQRLREHRYPEGAISEGERDKWLFCAAVAMSWLAPPSVLERELSALAHEAAGWKGRETRSRMSSALARAKAVAEGARINWNGTERDPRYRMRASTVVDWLEIGPSEQRAAGLRLLVDADRRRELNTERTRKSRRRRGATSHAEKRAARLELGQRALWLARDGLTVRQIAEDLGTSPATVSRAIKEVRSGKEK